MKKILVFILISIVFTGCWKVIIAPYDTEFNTTRKKVGLRIIDSTFVVKKIVEDHIKQSPITRKVKGVPPLLSEIKKPTYVYKKTYLDENNGKIIYEEDIFISGVTKVDFNDIDVTEKLIFRYIFKDYIYKFKKPPSLGGDVNEKYTKGWKYIYEYPVIIKMTSNTPNMVFYDLIRKIISKKEADSILKSWKLKRLNY